jgi:GntR family transcriptional regulator
VIPLASERFARANRERGKAAFVAEAEKAGYAPGVDRIEVRKTPAPSDISERLGLKENDPVIVRERRCLANGEPVEFCGHPHITPDGP